MPSELTEDETYKRMRLAICSGNRRQLLLSLNEGNKSLGDLREEVPSDPATIVHALRELERYHMVQQNAHRDYALTVIGRALVQKVIDCRCMAETLALHEAFWSEHDVSGIPDHLFNRIGALRESALVVDSQDRVLRASDTAVALVKEGDVLELVTPVYSAVFLTRLFTFIANKKVAYLIMTDDVLHLAIDDIGKDRAAQALKGGVKINVMKHDPRLFLVLTADTMALSLPFPDGTLDFSQLLTSKSSEALEWGRELFHYCLRWSENAAL